jgi:hypothetical protein
MYRKKMLIRLARLLMDIFLKPSDTSQIQGFNKTEIYSDKPV